MFISMQNSKTGPSFNLPAIATCPGKTKLCASLCYAERGRMGLPFQKNRRQENLDDVLFYLKEDPSGEILTDMLCRALKWKKNTGFHRNKLETLRIHDSGDFFSPVYTKAWLEVVRRNPNIRFWAYTRSFAIGPIAEHLKEMAALPNMSLWLSADAENWEFAIMAYMCTAGVPYAGIAWMQTEGSEETAKLIQEKVGAEHFINFPVHGSVTGSKNQVIETDELRNCPVTTGELKPDWKNPPCIQCNWCLPV